MQLAGIMGSDWAEIGPDSSLFQKLLKNHNFFHIPGTLPG